MPNNINRVVAEIIYNDIEQECRRDKRAAIAAIEKLLNKLDYPIEKKYTLELNNALVDSICHNHRQLVQLGGLQIKAIKDTSRYLLGYEEV